jgi:predicted lipoprotein with Yx(FWY)xxD motif
MSAPRILSFLTAAVILVAACSTSGSGAGPYGGGGGAASPAAAGGGASAAAGGGASAAAGAVVVGSTASASFGTVLTGPNGMTLYTHAGDTATSSTCTGSCATAWPPLTATGQATLGPGVAGQLGSVTRDDGTTQVTYNGLPVYYWQADTKAGDVTGDGVEGFSVAKVGAPGAMPAASGAAPSPSEGGKGSY